MISSGNNDPTLLDDWPDMKLLAAVKLYELGRLTNEQAAAFANLSPLEFEQKLEDLSIPPSLPPLVTPASSEADLGVSKVLFANLVAVNQAITSHLSLPETLQNVMDIAMELTRAKEAGLFLVDLNGVVSYSLFSSHINAVYHDQRYIGLIMDQGLAGWVLRHKKMALVLDTEHDDRWLDLPGDNVIHRSALVIPILNGGVPVGILTLTHPVPHHFTPDDAHFMLAAADQIALALYNAQLYEDKRQQADRLHTLYTVLQTVGAHLQPETAIEKAVHKVAELTGWPAVTIFLVDETGEFLVNTATAGYIFIPTGQRRIQERGIAGRAYLYQQTQYVVDAAADLDDDLEHPALKSKLAVPMRSGRQIIGIFTASSTQMNAFDQQDITLAESLAEAIALALSNARLYAETQHRLREQTTLRQAYSLISSTLDLPTVFHLIAEQLCRTIGVTSTYICGFDEKQRTAVVLAEYYHEEASHTEQISDLYQTYDLHVFSPTTIDALLHGQVQIMHQDDPHLAPNLREHMATYGCISALMVPFQVGETTLAYASLWESRHRHEFTPTEIALCQGIAQHAASAMRHAQLFRTITEERGRLQTLIESSRDGLILIGVTQDILVMNELALHLLSLPGSSEDWIHRSTGHLILHLRHQARGAAHMLLSETRRIINGNEPPGEGEFEVRGHTIHWLNLPVMSEETTLGRLFVFRDVTKERLVESMRKDLIRTMIHDFRNPLTAIIGTVQLLELGLTAPPTPNQRQLFDVTYSTVKKMLEMVNSIMEINQLQSDQFPLEYEVFSPVQLLQEVLISQQPIATTRQINLNLSLTDPLPLVYADRTLIERTLRNLVGNALKFTPIGGAILVTAKQVTTLRERGNTRSAHLLIEVHDTGPGIAPGLRERLFNKFAVGAQRERGHGLGLAFCKMAIEAHGEQIWLAESANPAYNTTFAFTLPIYHESKTPYRRS